MKSSRVWRVDDALCWIAVFIGVVLRTVQYVRGGSLWVDEAALARTIVDGSFAAFLHPLPFSQVAPPLFLVVERWSAAVFGPTERALRLLPFVCSVLSLPVFVRIARRFSPRQVAWLPILMFSVGTPFVFFGSDLKPYAGDVLSTLIVIDVVTTTAIRGIDRQPLGLLVALALLSWISHVALLVLAGTGLALALFEWKKGPHVRGRLIAIAVAWAVIAGPSAYLAERNVTPAAATYLHRRWLDAFPPHRPLAAARWAWQTCSSMLDHASTDTLDGALHYPAWWAVGALAVLGMRRLASTMRAASAVMFAPTVTTLLAAAAHAYPFTGRFVMFLLPPVLVAVGAGVAECGDLVDSTAAAAVLSAAIGVVAFAGIVRTLPPQSLEDITPVLAHIHNGSSSAPIYVYYGAGQAFLFYAPRFGFDSRRYTVGRCARGDQERAFEELDVLKGAPRAWVVFSHIAGQRREYERLLQYLRVAGRELDVVGGRGRDAAIGFEYDFSDPRRWERAKQVVSPLPAARERTWECGGPMTPLPE